MSVYGTKVFTTFKTIRGKTAEINLVKPKLIKYYAEALVNHLLISLTSFYLQVSKLLFTFGLFHLVLTNS